MASKPMTQRKLQIFSSIGIMSELLHSFWSTIVASLEFTWFYGQVPEAVNLSAFNVQKYADSIRGDVAERKVFYTLKEYFTSTGDDVLIVHSHKFLHKDSQTEKDFIIFNLSKGTKYFIKPYNKQKNPIFLYISIDYIDK